MHRTTKQPKPTTILITKPKSQINPKLENKPKTQAVSFCVMVLWWRCLHYALATFIQLTFIFISFQTFTSSTSFLTVQFSLSIHSFDFRSNFLFTKTNNRLTVFPAMKSRAKRGPGRISAETKPHLDTPGGQEGPPAHFRFLSNCL